MLTKREQKNIRNTSDKDLKSDSPGLKLLQWRCRKPTMNQFFNRKPGLVVLLLVMIWNQSSASNSSINNNNQDIIQNLTLVPGSRSIEASWSLSRQSQSNLSQYRVAWKGSDSTTCIVKQPEDFTEIIDTSNCKQKLAPCSEYYVSVTPLPSKKHKTISTGTTTTLQDLPKIIVEGDNVTTDARSITWKWQQACNVVALISYSGTPLWEQASTGLDNESLPVNITSTESYSLQKLQPHYNYTICASAVTGLTNDTMEECTTVETKEEESSEPQDLMVSPASPGSVLVSWQRPAVTNGRLGSYSINWANRTETTNETSYELKGLEACSNYNVTVRARTGAGLGVPAIKEIALEAKAPSTTGVFCALTFEQLALNVTWDQPVTVCNITHYRVSWSNENGSGTGSANSTGSSYTFTEDMTSLIRNVCVVAVVEHGLEGEPACCKQREKMLNDQKPDDARDEVPIGYIFAGVVVGVLALLLIILVIVKKNAIGTMIKRSRLNSYYPCEVDGYYVDVLMKVAAKAEQLNLGSVLDQEFEEMRELSKTGETFTAEMKMNINKNRYSNVLPFDVYRVKLTRKLANETNYINASYVPNLTKGEVNFIATQHPMDTTVDDFWWMVWEQNVRIIVMLGNCSDDPKDKFCQYWKPTAEHHCSFKIVMVQEEKQPYYTLRKIQIFENNKTRQVKLFQFTNWPDLGVPNPREELLELVKDAREAADSKQNNKIIVHCSAGVGRAGTFIALWNLEVAAEAHTENLDIQETVLTMRQYRKDLVEKPEQYRFLYGCFATYLQDMGRWAPAGDTQCDSEDDAASATFQVSDIPLLPINSTN